MKLVKLMEELREKMDKTRNSEHPLSEIIKITDFTKYNKGNR